MKTNKWISKKVDPVEMDKIRRFLRTSERDRVRNECQRIDVYRKHNKQVHTRKTANMVLIWWTNERWICHLEDIKGDAPEEAGMKEWGKHLVTSTSHYLWYTGMAFGTRTTSQDVQYVYTVTQWIVSSTGHNSSSTCYRETAPWTSALYAAITHMWQNKQCMTDLILCN